MTVGARIAMTLLLGQGLVATQAWAQGCAMCATALVDDPIGRAFSWGVLFLMAAPYAIVATIGGYLLVLSRRAPAQRRAAIIDLSTFGRPAGRPEGGPS